MDENYFSTLRYFGEIATVKNTMRDLQHALENARFSTWNKENPNLDILRQNAKNAVEAYANALEHFADSETDRLYDKLDGSDQVINWRNLFKKLGHP